MKIHSFAFYNGHLAETKRRLSELDKPEKASKARPVRYPSSRTRLQEIRQDDEQQPTEQTSAASVKELREVLALELTSPLGNVTYPENLTAANFVHYLFSPTLCYELEYPRTEKMQWLELFYKTLAVFGCIFLLAVTSDEFIIPVLEESAARLQSVNNLSEGALILAETISRLLFPFMVTFLLVFLVIFEYVLGAFAEITRKCA